jgi:hypothetical protein
MERTDLGDTGCPPGLTTRCRTPPTAHEARLAAVVAVVSAG